MDYALIFQGKVIQIEKVPFPVHPSMIWLEIDKESVSCGYIYKDGEIKPAPEIKPVYKIDPIAALLTALSLFVTGILTKEDVADAYNNAMDALSKMVIRIN
jgi:hypothetical protein